MISDTIRYSESRDLPLESVLSLSRANEWSSAEKPELLHKALLGSHSLVTAWDGARLIGLGNAISDGCLVVYYPHLLVLPEYQGRGIGTRLMQMLMARYDGFHQHMLVAAHGYRSYLSRRGETSGLLVQLDLIGIHVHLRVPDG